MFNKTENSMKIVLALAAVLAVFGLVGEMDYQDELKEMEHYEAMVCDGNWPNFKNLEVNCNGH
jgi:hypothetical protein